MDFFTCLILGLTFLGTLLWFLIHRNNQRNYTEFAHKRNVRYLAQPNVFLQMLKKQRLEVLRHRLIAKEGNVFGFNFLGKRTILVTEPEIAQLVLIKEFTNFTNRRHFDFPNSFLVNAMSNVKDTQWKRLRAIVSPTFASGKLKRMKPLIDDTLRTLERNFNSALAGPRHLVNVKELFAAFTIETILQVAFGSKVDSLADQENQLIRYAQKLFSVDISVVNLIKFTLLIMTPKLAKFLNIRTNAEINEYFSSFSGQLIAQKRQEMKMNTEKPDKLAACFIELLLEIDIEINEENTGSGLKSKYITNDEIISQCVLFLLAGYDTTATTITMASYLLAVNSSTQEKLYREITSVIEELIKEAGQEGPKELIELVTIESLPRFEYLSAIVQETLRLYPPGTFVEREASNDIELKTEDGLVSFSVKKGDIVHFPVYSMHRDATQFSQPEAFKPERFIGEPTFHKYSYLPFGAGPRNCVAKYLALLEAKLALLHTVRQFKFSVAPETKIPPEFYNHTQLIVPKDIILKVEKRC